MFATVAVNAAEQREPRPGDELVSPAGLVMDRGVHAPRPSADRVAVHLGKRGAGWYLPRRLERFVPPSRRATREIDSRWQQLAPGDVIPDSGGPDETFTVVTIDPPIALVYRSRRGRTDVTWSILLRPDGEQTRVLQAGAGPHPPGRARIRCPRVAARCVGGAAGAG